MKHEIAESGERIVRWLVVTAGLPDIKALIVPFPSQQLDWVASVSGQNLDCSARSSRRSWSIQSVVVQLISLGRVRPQTRVTLSPYQLRHMIMFGRIRLLLSVRKRRMACSGGTASSH